MTITENTVEAPASTGPLRRFEASCAMSVATMSLHEVRAHMHLARSVKAMAEARLIELNRRMTELAVAPGLGCAVDPRRELQAHGGLRARDARAVEIQASAIEAAPPLGHLLAAGATTSAHVEALGHALATAGPHRDVVLGHLPQITHRAATASVDDFDRYVKKLARDAQSDGGVAHFEHQRRSTHAKKWTDRDGMMRWIAAFDPESGARFDACIERQVEIMFHSGDRDIALDVAPGIDPNDHRRALALLHLVTRPAGSTSTDAAQGHAFDARPARAEIVVHVDHRTLVEGLHASSVCRTSQGSDLPPATARRLACDADIIPIVMSGDGVPLDVGRAKRLATIHQRRALEARHTTCAIDGCDTAFSRCVIHHIEPWERGGRTDLDNLVPLCNRHHHAVHEGGWTLRMCSTTREVTVTLPGVPPDPPV